MGRGAGPSAPAGTRRVGGHRRLAGDLGLAVDDRPLGALRRSVITHLMSRKSKSSPQKEPTDIPCALSKCGQNSRSIGARRCHFTPYNQAFRNFSHAQYLHTLHIWDDYRSQPQDDLAGPLSVPSRHREWRLDCGKYFELGQKIPLALCPPVELFGPLPALLHDRDRIRGTPPKHDPQPRSVYISKILRQK